MSDTFYFKFHNLISNNFMFKIINTNKMNDTNKMNYT